MGKLGVQTYYDDDAERELTIVDSSEYDVVDRQQRESQREYYRRQDAIKTGGNTRYVNCYHDPIKGVSTTAELHVLGALTKLLPYMSYERRGVLISASKRMGIDEVAAVIGKKSRASKDIVRQLKESGVLVTEKEGRRDVYAISETYHSIGQVRQDERYTKFYQTAARQRLEKVTIQAAGLLYMMIPYFNYEYYYLSENPDERDVNKVKAMTMRSLARTLGADPMVVLRHVKELQRAGFVIVSVAYDAAVIKVNPDVMYRKKYRDERAEALKAEFSVHERTIDAMTWDDIGADLLLP